VGWHKCNVDAFSAVSASGATGVVLRDHDGQFLAGRVVRYSIANDALMVEALTCEDGLQLAQQSGVSKLCLETDCLELLNLWKALDMQRSVVNLILQDIKCIGWSFDEFTFVYANRTCNRVAHECVRQVAHELDPVEWHLNPPNSLRNLLEDDCNHVLV
jgi:hypothetical protein